jgi:hypothetical protein
MTIDEIRAIREATSLETIGMTTEELHQHFARGATDIERRIAEIRKKRGIVVEPSRRDSADKQSQRNEHAFIRGAEYYANLTKANADANTGNNMAVHEPKENYNQMK